MCLSVALPSRTAAAGALARAVRRKKTEWDTHAACVLPARRVYKYSPLFHFSHFTPFTLGALLLFQHLNESRHCAHQSSRVNPLRFHIMRFRVSLVLFNNTRLSFAFVTSPIVNERTAHHTLARLGSIPVVAWSP